MLPWHVACRNIWYPCAVKVAYLSGEDAPASTAVRYLVWAVLAFLHSRQPHALLLWLCSTAADTHGDTNTPNTLQLPPAVLQDTSLCTSTLRQRQCC
jgi:hypothetical protein